MNYIQEDRIEPFVKLSGTSGAFEWETGLRYQQTDVEIDDATADEELQHVDTDYGILLPSAHLRWNLDDERRMTFSLARTLRRPGLDQISPALRVGELGDNELLGNTALEPEPPCTPIRRWLHSIGATSPARSICAPIARHPHRAHRVRS